MKWYKVRSVNIYFSVTFIKIKIIYGYYAKVNIYIKISLNLIIFLRHIFSKKPFDKQVKLTSWKFYRNNIFWYVFFSRFPVKRILESVTYGWTETFCRPVSFLERYFEHFTLYSEDLRATRKHKTCDALHLYIRPVCDGTRSEIKEMENRKMEKKKIKKISYETKCTKRTVPSFLAETERPI